MQNTISDNSSKQEGTKFNDTEEQIVEACTLAFRVKKSLESWPMEAQLAFKSIVGWKEDPNSVFIPQFTQIPSFKWPIPIDKITCGQSKS